MPSRRCPLTVAFQGEAGAFGHAAVRRLSAHAEAVPVATFAGVVLAVCRGAVAAGVLPVENSIVGPIEPSVRALSSATRVMVVDEVDVPVRLCLLGTATARLGTIDVVHSQTVALGQCRRFLSSHPRMAPRAMHDTAGAARYVASVRDHRVAAVASALAAQRYGLRVVVAGIEDRPGNVTRFVVVIRRPARGGTSLRP